MDPFEKLPLMKIHGHPVLAFAQTEVQSTGPCGIILVQTRQINGDNVHNLSDEFVTAWYRLGDREWGHGHYYSGSQAREKAWEDFVERVKNNGGVK